MYQENVDPALTTKTIRYFEYLWKRTNGSSPQVSNIKQVPLNKFIYISCLKRLLQNLFSIRQSQLTSILPIVPMASKSEFRTSVVFLSPRKFAGVWTQRLWKTPSFSCMRERCAKYHYSAKSSDLSSGSSLSTSRRCTSSSTRPSYNTKMYNPIFI